MAKGNEIIVTGGPAGPRGLFMEGTITGALYPGICVQIDVSEGLDANGNCTWEPYNTSADGEQRLVAILLPDTLRGKTATDAYADGDHGFVYIPVAGDQLNLVVSNLSGTGDDHAFGDLLMIDDGTGELVATTGTPEMESFQLLEAIVDPTADTLAHVIYTGH